MIDDLDDEWQPPPAFDEYRVVRRLGGGAMGEVYLCDDVLLERQVAVKFVRTASEAASQRFYVEARAIARLQHPHVVAAYRIGRVRQRPYLVSEYVAGLSLDQLSLPLPVERVVEIGAALASGLAAAHRRGVLHRDVKPANAMVSDVGEVKLLDFGLAKLLDEAARPPRPLPMREPRGAPTAPGYEPPVDAVAAATASAPASAPASRDATAAVPASVDATAAAPASGAASVQIFVDATAAAAHTATAERAAPTSQTRPGSLLGTPLYMAPELWRSEPATPASDVYSLGALLYELAAGRAPHHAIELAELRAAVTGRDAPPLASVAPDAPDDLARIIDRCVQRDPAARFATAEQLRAELDRLRAPAGDAAPRELPRDPYRGLHAFAADSRAVFHGRRDDARAVIDRLRREPLVVVAGDSGVGKSSLCAAGVLPELVDRGLARIRDRSTRVWSWIELVPGRRPLAALAVALAPVAGLDEGALAAALVDDPVEVARGVRQRLGIARGVVIYVDQLEELVTVADPAEAARTAEALGELALRAPSLRVLATARNDCLTRLIALPGLGAEIAAAVFLLGPLTDDGIRDAIVAPAHAAGFAFESEAMVGELAAHGGSSLPLLQFALAALWDARDAARRVLPAAALAALGGVGGALAGHADRVIDSLVAGERDAARRVLLRLVTADGARIRRDAAELAVAAAVDGDGAAGDDLAVAAAIDERAALEALVRGRIVVARGADGGAGTYEIAHDVLLAVWGRLRGWMTGDVQRRALRERLERAVRDWERLGRPAEALWSRPQLAELAAVAPGELGRGESGFVAASRRAVRRLAIVRRGALVAALMIAALGYAGFRLQARRALADQVAAQLAIADRALAEADKIAGEVATAERAAFAAFDAVPLDDRGAAAADAAWTARNERAAALPELYERAENALDAARVLDSTRDDVLARFAELLATRALAADRDHRPAERDRYLRKLAPFDPSGALRRRWSAPVSIAVRSRPAGAAIEVARYADDPRRALGPWQPLGAAPVSSALAPGSYLLRITAAGRPPVRYPVVVEGGAPVAIDVDVPARVPDGYIYVPAGRFLYGSTGDERERVTFGAQPIHPLDTGSFLIARTEVTFGDWIAFLEAQPAVDRKPFLPRGGDESGLIELAPAGRGWRLRIRPDTGDGELVATDDQPLVYANRDRRKSVDWRRMPVSGISWNDGLAYAAWLDRTGRLPGARPCNEREWERAARGADDRRFPGGELREPDDANIDETYGKQDGAYGLDEVGSHPASDSPFGVADMVGNVAEWTRSEKSSQFFAHGVLARAVQSSDDVVLRSASYYRDRLSNLLIGRNFSTATIRNHQIGARMCADSPPLEP